MKKTFKQLTVGDVFYRVIDESMTYEKHEAKEVYHNSIVYGYSYKCTRPNETRFKEEVSSGYSTKYTYYYFTSEADAIRFCKTRLMKTLFNKIESAKREVEKIKAFKLEHLELLNHEWTEEQIDKLERQIQAA